jgi:N-acetyl-gamma-glutamyl-phosphate reductase
MKTTIHAGIIGGAGYTAGELIRLLIHHPHAKMAFVHSSSHAGSRITDVHEGLIGETDLVFSAAFDLTAIDVLFLCSAHGDSRRFMETHSLPATLKVIDLSMDYRHRDSAGPFIYGLPEQRRETIRQSKYIANPGCFATAIQLALLPLAERRLLSSNDIHIHAVTGSTGAGVKPSATTHFSWRDNNLSAYKVFEHQHLKEIGETLHLPVSQLNFIPLRGNFSRGIFASAYMESDLSQDEAVQIFSDFYRDAAFTFLTDRNPDLKQAVNTNKCLLHVEKHGNKLLILSVIDNLLKGASGQAVQNMNLMFGWDETAGLHLKATGF